MRQRTGILELRGGTYWARLTQYVDGKRERPRYDLGTEDEATARKRMAALVAKVPSTSAEPSSAPKRFAAWREAWVAERKASGVAMWDSERGWLAIYAGPILDHKLLGDVRPRDVLAVLKSVVAAGRSQGTVSHVRATLNRCLGDAWREELIAENPVLKVQTPTVRGVKKERVILTDTEVLQLIACVDVDLEIRLLSLCARAEGGMRTRDLTAWTWQHIELPAMRWCIVPRTKTGKPQRLEIPDLLAPSLRAWWRAAGEPVDGPVFPVTKGKRKGEPRKTRGVSFADRLRRALLVAGVDRHDVHVETEVSLPADFHSFRRAFSTALGRAGVNEQSAMQLAGHADSRAHHRYLMTSDAPLAIPAGALPQRAQQRAQPDQDPQILRAGHEIRTRDPQLGKMIESVAEVNDSVYLGGKLGQERHQQDHPGSPGLIIQRDTKGTPDDRTALVVGGVVLGLMRKQWAAMDKFCLDEDEEKVGET